MKDPDVIKLSYKNFVFQFGRASITTAKVTIWDGSVATFNTLNETSNTLFSVISGSVNDKVGGGGATHFKFLYQKLDGIERESSEIALNGDSAVDIPFITGAIIYNAWITKTEDDDEITGPNHGIIKLYKTGTVGDIFAEIPVAEGQTMMCIYRVPSTHYAELRSLYLDAGLGKAATIWLRTRKDRASAWRTQATFTVYQNGREHERFDPKFIAPGTDIVIIGKAAASATDVNAHFELELKSLED